MSNGILDLMADTAVGMFSGNRRLENFEQREKTREDFAPGEMGDFSYDRYMQAFKEARDAAFADSLASDLKTTALGSAVAPYQETYGLVESLVPGGVKPLSEEEREIFQSRRIKTPVDMEFLEKQLGSPPTEEDIKAAEEFIYQNSPTSNIAYALGLIAEVKAPALFLTKYGPKALKAMYNFIKQKPKTTAAGAAAATVGTSSEAEALPIKIKPKALKLKSEATKKIEEAASAYQSQGMSRDAAKKVAKYNSPEFLDLVKNTYDKLTIKNSAGDIIATPSSRALSKELKLGVNFDFKKYNIPEELSLSFSSNNKAYDAYVNAQKTANKTNKIVPGGKTNVQLFFPNATKEIQLLNQLKNKVFTGTKGQSKVTQRDIVKNLFAGEAQKGEATLRSYLKNTSLTDDMAKALNIDSRLVGTKLNQIDAFHYKLPENLPSQSVVDRNAAIKAWKETAPQWQLDLWSEAKKTISKYNKFFPDDARALDHIAPFINSVNKIKTQHPKNWQILTRDDNNTLKKILFEGVDSKLGAMNTRLNNLKKGSEEYNLLKKEMERVFQETIEQLTDKSIFYNTTQRGIPINFRATNIDKSTNPIDVLKNTLAEMSEQTTTKVEGLKNINPKANYKFKKGGRVREKFQLPGSTNDSEEERMKRAVEEGKIPGTINYAVKQALNPVQDQIRSVYEERLQPFFEPPIQYGILKKEELEKELSNRLNPPKTVKFKFSELPKLVTEGPITQALTTDPRVAGLETIEFIYNSLRKGVENDIEMEEKFPKIYKMNELTRVKGPGSTPKEADYLSVIDEINRAADTGLTNFAYNVGDLLFSIPDAVLPTEFTDELKRRYEKSDLARPETFVGQISAVALEFGIPGGIAFKLINRFRKFTAARTGGKLNLFTQKTYELEGLPKLGVQISNVFKRVGTGAISFGAGDFVAGGPYNTISEMFDDPLLTSKYVGQYEDTSNLSGKERVVANFKNRLRFGAEGAMIGGLFPLVGPVLGTIGKNVLLKPALFLGGGALKIADTVAIKPATYLASLDPVVIPGIARGTGAFAKFLGQDVVARLAATAATGGKAFVPSLKGNFGQLPEFSKWRMFDVTSNDPLERGLKKVDNFLKWFRDSGNQALYGFNLSGGAERFIKAKSREVEKYLDSIEKKAYDLANGFLGRYNKGFTSPAGERHMLEQVFEYLRGNLKLSKIQPELQEMSKVLKDEFNALKQAYFKELPEGSGLRAALESNLDKYMRMSFATFTNPKFAPDAKIVEQATDFMVNIINRNEDFLEAAVKGVSPTAQTAAVREFARKNVENIINIGKREGVDPMNALNKINREILRGDEVFLQTGEELPKVIRNLLGQEKSLRNSVMMTTGSLVSQTANIRSFKEFARHGLENGYLFTSRAEALAAGVMDPKQIRELPGLGPMQDLVTADKDGPVGLFASNELKQTMEGTGGMLDNLLQNSFYQSLIAYKAAVQTGKTVFSPATQTRNFGSAGFFPMHVGHIGGGASVTDAFKITLDDIFGAGRTVNEADLIKRISRKIELGVLDENIVASELGAILKDIKAGKLQSLGKLAERAENTKFYKQATRVYAGGDNIWKWYGHEYYMSQLKGAFRNVDDVKKFFKDIHGIEFNTKNIMTGATKSLDEGIEEAAAFLLRETYPTYSKVPEFIKAIRKLPIGNFVSFTSEILRTGFSTSAIAMKHIASDNQALREMGYRMLSGQAITLGGMTAGAVGLGHALTNVTPTQMEVYKQYFAPEYMQYSTLIPVTNHKDGSFKVFDLSRYNPYDIIVSSAKELMKVAERQNYSTDVATLKEQLSNLDPDSDEAKAIRQQIKDLNVRIAMNKKLDSDKIETNNLKTYLNAVGPLYNAVTGTFFGIPIGAEAFIEAYTGRTRQGSPIWSTGMVPTEIFDRAMGHFFKTIEPGIISSGRKLFYSVRGDVSGVGQPLEVDTEMFKLMGGSNVTVDVLGSLDFKISDFQKSFREARVAKDYFSVENFKSRGPEQLVREYREQNEQAFRAQYEFYKAAMAAIDSGLLTRVEVMKALTNRISPGSDTIPEKVQALMQGRYNALSYGPEGLKSRREKIIRNDPTLDTGRYSLQYFLPFGALENEKAFWQFKKFSDFEEKPEREQQSAIPQPFEGTPTAQAAEPPVPPLADTPDPVVAPQVSNVDQATGLTTTETALLSPGEQAIRRRQRGIA